MSEQNSLQSQNPDRFIAIGNIYNVFFTESDITIVSDLSRIFTNYNKFLDNKPLDERSEVAEATLVYLQRPNPDVTSPEFANFPANIQADLKELDEFVRGLTTERRDRFMSHFSKLLRVSVDLQKVTDVRKYIMLKEDEASLYVDVIFDGLADTTVHQRGFGRFSRRFKRIMQMDNLADAYQDFDEDLSKDKMSYTYLPENREKLRREYNRLLWEDQTFHVLSRRRVDYPRI